MNCVKSEKVNLRSGNVGFGMFRLFSFFEPNHEYYKLQIEQRSKIEHLEMIDRLLIVESLEENLSSIISDSQASELILLISLMKYGPEFGDGPFDLKLVTRSNIQAQNWLNVLLLCSVNESKFISLEASAIFEEIAECYSNELSHTKEVTVIDVLMQYIRIWISIRYYI